MWNIHITADFVETVDDDDPVPEDISEGVRNVPHVRTSTMLSLAGMA